MKCIKNINVASSIILLVFMLACNPPSKQFASNKKDSTNIVLIIVDDLRPALGCYGDTLAITPEMDKIASHGIQFNRAYCQMAVCNPSRASFLTGRRPDSLKVWDLHTNFRELYPDLVTLPQYFKNRGYRTQAIGKIFHDPSWAKDSISWTEPQLHTVTTFEGKYHTPENMAFEGSKGYPTEIAENPGESYIDIRVRNAALNFLNEKSDKPFFLAVGFRRPHLPFSAPRKFWELHDSVKFNFDRQKMINIPSLAFHNFKELRGYVGMPEEGLPDRDQTRILRHGYYASTSYIDRQIGLIWEQLEEQNLLDNTIVLITSDHGFHLAEHDLWCKTSNFELDTHVPLIVYTPHLKKIGQTDALVELVDLYPSLVEIAGFQAPQDLHGKSFLPAMKDFDIQIKEYAISQFTRPPYYPQEEMADYMGYSYRTDRYRLIQWKNMHTVETDIYELYDHISDPNELVNLAVDAGHTALLDSLIKLTQPVEL